MSQFQWLADNHGEEYRAVRLYIFYYSLFKLHYVDKII